MKRPLKPPQRRRAATRIGEVVTVLRRLNEARRIGQGYAAELLSETLDDIDGKGGYSRNVGSCQA